jgi:diacylglycerol O-acyltransferase / wax synthase
MTKYQRLSAQDASFLYAESPASHMHVGWTVLLDDPTLTEEKLRRHLEARLHLAPRLRKRVAHIPFEAGRPVLVDDPHFDLRMHVRSTTLPDGATEADAWDLVQHIMSVQLDRQHPLWEVWVFDWPGGKKGILQKIHHALVDGVSAMDLSMVLMDFDAGAAEPSAPETWTPEEQPSRSQLFREAIAERTRSSGALLKGLRKAVAHRDEALPRLRKIGDGLLQFGKANLQRAPRTSLTVPVSGYPRYTFAAVSLADIRAIKKAGGYTVNDVVLALVTGGFRKLLLSRGDNIEGLTLRTLVPVSVRSADDHSLGNQVSMLAASLPVGEGDVQRRLVLVAEEMRVLKESNLALGANAWIRSMDHAPTLMTAWASRLMTHQQSVNTYVTNVAGPPVPMYVCGSKILATIPHGPVSGQMSVGVAVVSYNGTVHIGLTGDHDGIPDLQVLADGIKDTLAELKSLVETDVDQAAE